MWLREDPAGITCDILVQPRSSRERLGPVVGDRLKVAVTAPPVEGEANQAVVAFFARTLHVPRSQVAIVSGETGRRKTVRILGTRACTLEAFVQSGAKKLR